MMLNIRLNDVPWLLAFAVASCMVTSSYAQLGDASGAGVEASGSVRVKVPGIEDDPDTPIREDISGRTTSEQAAASSPIGFGIHTFNTSITDFDASSNSSLVIEYFEDGFLIDGTLDARSGSFPDDSGNIFSENGIGTIYNLLDISIAPDTYDFSIRWNWSINFSPHREDGIGGTSYAGVSFGFTSGSAPGFNGFLSVDTTGGDSTLPSSGTGYFEGKITPRTLPGNQAELDFRGNAGGSLSNLGPDRFMTIDYQIEFLIGPGSSLPGALLPDTSSAAPASDLASTIPTDEAAIILPADPYVFTDAPSGRWFDPVAADGFHYVIEDGSLFTEIIDFADGFDDPFRVFAEGQELGSFGQDDSVDFVALLGHGVSSFTVLGINPTVDGEDPLAFPIQLAFDTDTATFAQYAVASVPEPGSLLLLGLGSCALVVRRRRDRAK